MNILSWILLGLIAGTIANVIDPKSQKGGMFGAIVLGILGAMVGGFLANLIYGFDIVGFNFTSLAIATLGALFLLFVGRIFARD